MVKVPRDILLKGTAALITFTCGVGSGYLLFSQTEETTQIPQRLDSSQYRFTNPLLDDSDEPLDYLQNRDVKDLKKKIETLTQLSIQSGVITHGSVYYRDLNNGPWIYTGTDYDYKPASLFKIPLMIAFFKEAEKNPELLQTQVTYDTPFENVAVQNVDSSNETIEVGKTYTISELIERMIIYSDNFAAYLLLKHIDQTVVTSVFHDLDVPMEGIETSETPFGPRTYASFLRVLYNGTYLSKEYSEKALEILSRSTFKHGMRAALPEGTRASIKYGIAVNPDGSRQLHECGIIYWQDKNPYLLCIMTNGTNYEQMATFIKNVTTEVHNTLSHQSN